MGVLPVLGREQKNKTWVQHYKMGDMERMAATALCDKTDPTRLTWREIKDGWGSSTNFMLSYGLKPYNEEDCEEALEISRSLKGASVPDEQSLEAPAQGRNNCCKENIVLHKETKIRKEKMR